MLFDRSCWNFWDTIIVRMPLTRTGWKNAGTGRVSCLAIASRTRGSKGFLQLCPMLGCLFLFPCSQLLFYLVYLIRLDVCVECIGTLVATWPSLRYCFCGLCHEGSFALFKYYILSLWNACELFFCNTQCYCITILPY